MQHAHEYIESPIIILKDEDHKAYEVAGCENDHDDVQNALYTLTLFAFQIFGGDAGIIFSFRILGF